MLLVSKEGMVTSVHIFCVCGMMWYGMMVLYKNTKRKGLLLTGRRGEIRPEQQKPADG